MSLVRPAPACVVAAALSLSPGGCAEKVDTSESIVTAMRIIGVRADPAEAPPGTAVSFRALVAAFDGTPASSPIDWNFCVAPKPLTTDDVVATACFTPESRIPAGAGPSITATTPQGGCALFGPDLPPGHGQPRSPDATGGYYQPLSADLGEVGPTIFLARITCNLASASAATASAFAQAYVPNNNPTLLPLTASIDGRAAPLTTVPAGTRVDLTASWPVASAETYAYYDASSDSVTTRREAMSVAWYTSAGAFDVESTGRAADDSATASSNTWTSPGRGTTAHLWVVLRDDRGGVDFAKYDVVTQ